MDIGVAPVTDFKADVVVVGSGAGGGMAAWQLADAGASVLVLERGQWFRPEDSSARHADWEDRENVLDVGGIRSDPTVVLRRGADIPSGRDDAQSANRGGVPVGFTSRNPFRYQRAHGVGGSTLHYEGEAHRFATHAFKPASRFGWGVDWPVEYSDLAPWYERAERLLYVSGDAGNPFKAYRGPYPLPPHPLTARRRWVDAGAARLGWRNLANPLALPSEATPGRGPCMHSGHCHRGCPFGAKSSTDHLLKQASRRGNLKVLTDARVLRLEASGNRVNAAHFVSGGRLHVARGSQIILAAGALETPRLLLVSETGRFPDGLGNQNDQVGRHFMETVFVSRQFQADQMVQSWKGPPQDARIWDFNLPDTNRGIHGFTLGASAGGERYRGAMRFSGEVKGIGASHKAAMRHRFNRSIWFTGVTDHQPHPANRLLLSSATDSDGVPKLDVYTDYTQLELDTMVEMRRQIEVLAEACGATESGEVYSSYSQPSATHVGGTCLMGTDPASSVTNVFGQVHGLDNLHIVDGSVLPGQGMGDAPSLTIQALALRTADKIAATNP